MQQRIDWDVVCNSSIAGTLNLDLIEEVIPSEKDALALAAFLDTHPDIQLIGLLDIQQRIDWAKVYSLSKPGTLNLDLIKEVIPSKEDALALAAFLDVHPDIKLTGLLDIQQRIDWGKVYSLSKPGTLNLDLVDDASSKEDALALATFLDAHPEVNQLEGKRLSPGEIIAITKALKNNTTILSFPVNYLFAERLVADNRRNKIKNIRKNWQGLYSIGRLFKKLFPIFNGEFNIPYELVEEFGLWVVGRTFLPEALQRNIFKYSFEKSINIEKNKQQFIAECKAIANSSHVDISLPQKQKPDRTQLRIEAFPPPAAFVNYFFKLYPPDDPALIKDTDGEAYREYAYRAGTLLGMLANFFAFPNARYYQSLAKNDEQASFAGLIAFFFGYRAGKPMYPTWQMWGLWLFIIPLQLLRMAVSFPWNVLRLFTDILAKLACLTIVIGGIVGGIIALVIVELLGMSLVLISWLGKRIANNNNNNSFVRAIFFLVMIAGYASNFLYQLAVALPLFLAIVALVIIGYCIPIVERAITSPLASFISYLPSKKDSWPEFISCIVLSLVSLSVTITFYTVLWPLALQAIGAALLPALATYLPSFLALAGTGLALLASNIASSPVASYFALEHIFKFKPQERETHSLNTRKPIKPLFADKKPEKISSPAGSSVFVSPKIREVKKPEKTVIRNLTALRS